MKESAVYCEAKFAAGSGLGNRLFPWARCKLFSEANRIPMLAPAWVQARLGPLKRGGLSLSAYHRQILLIGLFRRDGYVSGLEKMLVSARASRVSEPENLVHELARESASPVIVSFEGDRHHFAELAGRRQRVLELLRNEAKPKWVALADRMASPLVVNVRCANDFRVAVHPDEYRTQGALKTPLDWFITSLRFVRRAWGQDVPAVVVSDGTVEQLRTLLNEPNVRFARPGCAISDLLILAHARVLIGSGGSSFSAWGAFLSGAATITHPGQSLQWFNVDSSGDHNVGEFDPATSPPKWLASAIDHARAAWASMPTRSAH